ncbi:hypothetical protein MA16_Dca021976 [Dendrobium catenatum]|uniref:Uncharacterized protein n=1 Tax=Dendrobium catenatum TaxID=906689 RepID=A0A2I0WEL8_9ASPA|nr:hypothetical protein MA16_Dca021976 [Dendrobium catenatum]
MSADEIVENELPLALEVVAGLEGGGDFIVGADEKPCVHAACAGTDRFPGRVLGLFSKHGIFGYDELCRFRQRSTKALDLADRKAVTPESGDHLAALKLTLHRVPPHTAHCFPERRNDRRAEEAAAPED